MKSLYKATLILPDWHIQIIGGEDFVSFLSIFKVIKSSTLNKFEITNNPKPLKKFLNELEQYLNGKLVQFSYNPLPLIGTEFQKKVWQELYEIPYGQTKSYGEIAKKIGLPCGARAVGNACSVNPIPILIPCHRVIKSDGSLGGFTSGLDIKKKLLFIEGVRR